MPQRQDGVRSRRALEASTQESMGLVVDNDVAEEMDRMKQRCQEHLTATTPTKPAPPADASQPASPEQEVAAEPVQPSYAVELYGLRKEYRGGLFSRKPFVAVRSSWFGVLAGEGMWGVEDCGQRARMKKR